MKCVQKKKKKMRMASYIFFLCLLPPIQGGVGSKNDEIPPPALLKATINNSTSYCVPKCQRVVSNDGRTDEAHFKQPYLGLVRMRKTGRRWRNATTHGWLAQAC